MFLVVLLTGVTSLQGQTTAAPPAEKLTFEKLVKATKITLRDSAELPLEMKVSLTTSDPAGRIRKEKTGSYKLDFHGFNVQSSRGKVTFRGGWSTRNAAFNSALFFLVPAIVVAHTDGDRYRFDITEASETNPYVGLKATAISACQFEWADRQFPQHFCGPMNLEFNKDDLSLIHYLFEGAGLPIETNVDPFGKSTLLGYRMEVDFQTTLLPGDPKPFLIPKRSVTTIETNKGKVVINTAYALREKKK